MNALRGLFAVGFLARFSYALARNPVLPLFALYLGAGPEAIGFAVGVSTVTGIFFKLPSGALSDVIGRNRTMLAGLFVFGLMPLCYLFIDSYQALVIVRFLHGLATAIYGPVSMAVVAEIAGEKKGEMLSWFSSLMIVGTLLGAPIGGLVLHSWPGAAEPGLASFRTVFLLSAISGLASLVLGCKILLRSEKPTAQVGFKARLSQFTGGVREVLSDRRILATSGIEGLQNLAMGALEAFLPIYAVKVAGLNEFQAGLLWGVQIVMTMLSKPLLGRLSDRHGRPALIVAGLAVCALSFAAIPWLKGFWPLFAAALCFGLGEAFVSSSTAALIADLCRRRHFGAAMGAFGTIFDIGHASGPILSGLLLTYFSYAASFGALACLLLAAIPVFWRIVCSEASNGLSGQ